MSFNSYTPFKKRNLFPKYMIVFLLGISFALFFSSALTIVTGIENAVQYMKQIVLTDDGTASGTTGIVLDGSGSIYLGELNGLYNITGPEILRLGGRYGTFLAAGDNQTAYISLINDDGLGYDSRIYITASSSGDLGGEIYLNQQEEGDFGSTRRYFISHTGEHHRYTSTGFERMTIKSNGNIGINTTNPNAALDVSGNMIISGTGALGTMIAGKGTFSTSIKVPSYSSAPGSANGCSNVGAGAIRHEGLYNELCVCDGTSRKKVYSGSVLCIPGGDPDQIPDSPG